MAEGGGGEVFFVLIGLAYLCYGFWVDWRVSKGLSEGSGPRTNYLTYNGASWSTLSDVPVNGVGPLSQATFLPLPDGWDLAPDCGDSRSVAAKNKFGASCVVLADGSCSTGSFESSYGGQLTQKTGSNGKNYYSTNDKCAFFSLTAYCPQQILLVQCPRGHKLLDGYSWDAHACAPCAVNTYADATNTRECKSCQAGKTSAEGSYVCSDSLPLALLPSGHYPTGLPLMPGANIGNINLPKTFFLSFEIFPRGPTAFEGSVIHLRDSRSTETPIPNSLALAYSPRSQMPAISLLRDLRLRTVGFFGGMASPVEFSSDEALKPGVWQRVVVTVTTFSYTGATTLTVGALFSDSLRVSVPAKSAQVSWASGVSWLSLGTSTVPDVQVFAASPSAAYKGAADALLRDVVLCESEEACKCAKGQFLFLPPSPKQPPACVRCSPGMYSPAGGTLTSCRPCQADSYAADGGATSCSACPASMRSPPQAMGCSCSAGYRKNNATTVTAMAAVACVACEPGFYTDVDDEPVCRHCPANSVGGVAASACVCVEREGYRAVGTGSAMECVRCQPGEVEVYVSPYPDAAGNATAGGAVGGCVQCPAGKFSSSLRARECQPCSPLSVSQAGALSCVACPAHSEPDDKDPSLCKCLRGFTHAWLGAFFSVVSLPRRDAALVCHAEIWPNSGITALGAAVLAVGATLSLCLLLLLLCGPRWCLSFAHPRFFQGLWVNRRHAYTPIQGPSGGDIALTVRRRPTPAPATKPKPKPKPTPAPTEAAAAAATTPRSEAIEEATTCPTCFERFTEVHGARVPLVLPCGHTLCSACVDRLPSPKKCPTCRRGIGPNINGLPHNFTALHLLSGAAAHGSDDDYI